jgi:hypothetical protein
VAEKRKFAALAELNQQLEEPNAPEPAGAPVHAAQPGMAELGKGRGRPPTGKRSNPEWKLYSHFLKKKTQRAAVARLQAGEEGKDLSDVLEELLEGWLKR